ncbi:dipeptide/oligopeptide/nickel ABC transporter permease/ATP-binding protein [Faunimonas sp. B44]|uniref:dipeptide/oligopeptide/nickel ABC transporter permease/ATP-binding protein n=1 Tax=Faunimonas sp. B44 TaxID=3461493 RepID=UPI004043E31B
MTSTAVEDVPESAGRARPGSRVLGKMIREPATVAAFIGVAILVLLAVFAPVLAPYDPNFANIASRHQGPSWAHWFGTDDLGRDVLSRVLYGTRTAVWTSTISVALAMAVGVPVGLLVGFFGGWWDRLAMRATDILQSIPSLIFAFAMIAILGRGANQTSLAVAIVFAIILVRVTRALALRERELLYVDAARVAGMSTPHILFREILPNVAGPVIVEAAIMLGSAITIITSLTFLGLGLDAETVDWGGMLDEARRYQSVYPLMALPPGLAIIFAVLVFNFAGDGLRDALAGKQTIAKAARRAGSRPVPVPSTSGRAERPDVNLEVDGLSVAFPAEGRPPVEILSDVSLSLNRGEMVGLVGESGSGKSMTALAIMGLLPAPGQITGGAIRLGEIDLTALSERDLNRLRGAEISMIFQDSIASLSPVHTVGEQLSEPLRLHKGLDRAAAMKKIVALLDRVGVPNAAQRIHDYPHQFSGGMAQRAAIAMALSGGPSVLVADEPTTALDVTIQAQVLDLLFELKEQFAMSVLLITHDLGVVAESCDRVLVMYAGQIVEEGPVDSVLLRPRHPYTHGLLQAMPRSDVRVARLPTVRGSVPPPWDWPAGCRFAPRCPYAAGRCSAGPVPLVDGVRCVRAGELNLTAAA